MDFTFAVAIILIAGAIRVIAVLVDTVHIISRETEEGFELSVNGASVIDGGDRIQADAGAELIVLFRVTFENIAIAVDILNTEFSDEFCVTGLLFKFSDADAKIGEVVSIRLSELVDGSLLISSQAVLSCDKARNDLCNFITGNILFPAERAVRISFDDVFSGQLGNCLVSPGVRIDVRERIGCLYMERGARKYDGCRGFQ